MGHSFFAELKRRNVIRAAILYLGGVWALAQGIAQLGPAFGMPEWGTRWFVIAAAIGFPFWIAFAWLYEFTPEGVRRERDIAPGESIAPHTGRRLDFAIIAVLAVALVLLLTDRFMRRGATDAAPARSEKSIAVLPFENLSRDPDNAYFSEGIQDEILTRLAKIGALKVISRTSTRQYATRPANLPEVARELGVGNILEGSVQKAGTAVHINVQLIRALTDEHLWAETYDRKLDDVFGVEADVAKAVAEALRAKLLPAEHSRIARLPTQNAEAYDLYLRGLKHFNHADDQYNYAYEEEPQAIDLFGKALEKDPGFALASSALARAQMYMYWFGPDRTADRLDAAKAAAERALALQPDLGEAHYALALVAYWGHRDYSTALQELATARKTWPNSADIEGIDAAIVRRKGDFAGALAGFQRATEIDPRDSSMQFDLALTYAHLRRYAEADEAYLRSSLLTADPRLSLIRRAENRAFWTGDLAPMRAAVARLVPGSAEYKAMAYNAFELAWWERDFAAAAKIADAGYERPFFDSTNIALQPDVFAAWAYEAAGDRERAKSIYRKARARMQAALRTRPDDVDLHLALGFADAGLELRDEAIGEARAAIELMPIARDAVTGPGVQAYAAKILARVGLKDEAIAIIRQLLAIPSGRVMSQSLLKLDPQWDPLRDDPRFKALLSDGAGKQVSSAHG